MFAFFVGYILSIIITSIVIQKFKYRYKPFPKLKLTKFGISFFSTQRHRVKVSEKVVQIGEAVYVNYQNQIVVFQNVKNVILRNEYLFFTANGKVEILFNTKQFYKYFNILITSDGIDFSNLKQTAILDLMNNKFQTDQSINFNKFLNLIKNTLKIQINDDKITVLPNNLKISYQLTYKTHGKIKRINVKNTIGKN